MVRPCFFARSDSDIYFAITIPITSDVSFRTYPGDAFKFKSHRGIYCPGYKLRHDGPKLGSWRFPYRCFSFRSCLAANAAPFYLRDWCGQPVCTNGRSATRTGSTVSPPIGFVIRVVPCTAAFLYATDSATGVLSARCESILCGRATSIPGTSFVNDDVTCAIYKVTISATIPNSIPAAADSGVFSNATSPIWERAIKWC
jgi:hypothetical protein